MGEVVAIDLFCGSGGLTFGFERAGIEVVAGIDIDPACRYPYETNTNAPFLQRDILGVLTDDTFSDAPGLDMDEIHNVLPSDAITVLAGCAPCQPFSLLNNGDSSSSHEKWNMLMAMQYIVEELRPDIIAMENVAPLRNDKIYSENFRAWFEDDPVYHVWDDVINCKSYGVPQSRNRLILLASKFDGIDLVSPPANGTEVTVRRAFAALDAPELSAGDWKPEFHALHKAAGLRKTNQERIRHTAEGEDWHDLPEYLRPASEANSSYSAYGRMKWDEPAPTLTTKFFNWGSGRFGHPGYHEDESKSVDRAISFLEGAILQSFPPDYAFVPDGERPTHDVMGRLIGNAVPVRLASAIGGSIRRHLKDNIDDARFNEKHIQENHCEGNYEALLPPLTNQELLNVDSLEKQDSSQNPSFSPPVS